MTDANNANGGHHYRFTLPNKGNDDTNDSDVNQTTFISDPTQYMLSGDDNRTLDAGVYEPVIIGDKVWEDTNADGDSRFFR